jgi:hypothetical protein
MIEFSPLESYGACAVYQMVIKATRLFCRHAYWPAYAVAGPILRYLK